MGKLYQFGKFTLNIDEQTILADDRLIRLPTKEFEILQLLVENNGNLLTKDEMMKTIWADTFVEESNLAQYISRLRKILNTDGTEFIKTFSKKGYRFSADLTVLEDNPAIHRHLRLQVTQQNKNARQKLGLINSLAVLPFQLLGFRTDEEFLGLGITDALITQLTRISQIIVRPTSAILKYTDSNQKISEIKNELNVEAILQGNFQKIANKLRLTVQMIEAETEKIIWAEVFNSEINDIFSVQDEIAKKIILALNQQLSDDSQTIMTKRYTENIEAYQEYLKGKFYLNFRDAANVKKALLHFEKAIELEPFYAPAFAGIAKSYETLPFLDELPSETAFPKAKSATLRALEIDENLVEAHTSLGVCLMNYDWNWQGAEVSFQKAIELNDNFAEGHQVYATFLLRIGRIAEAIVELKKAQQLDPLSPSINTWLAESFNCLGEFETAILIHSETIKFSPNYFLAYYHLTLTYLFNNQLDKAIQTSAKALEFSKDISLTDTSLVLLQIVSGNKQKAREILDNLVSLEKTKYVSPVNIASCYAYFKEKNATLEWLKKGLVKKDPNITWIKVDKEFEFLRNESDFCRILKAIDL